MEKQEKGMKKWICLDCKRNIAFSSIPFINKNTDRLKAAEQQQICWGKNEPMKKISGFKLKILLKDQGNKALLQIYETGDWGGFKIIQKNYFNGWDEQLKKK